jgi:short-subunit dehydrogenase
MSDDPFKNKYGSWGLVAGSAEGLGEAYSIALAKRGFNLIMVDNQAEPLKNLSRRIESDFSVKTVQLHVDLCESDATTVIMQKVEETGCRLLIYNAAFSLIKPFIKLSGKELERFIAVNLASQIKLVHQFARYLTTNNHSGGILLMSSLAGLIGMQLVSTYSASKAFAWNLCEGLYYELKPYNIDVMACIAGTTETPTYLKSNPKYGFLKPALMKPETVVEAALGKIGKRALFIPGFSNQVSYFILTRLMPRKMASSIANKTMLTIFSHHINS